MNCSKTIGAAVVSSPLLKTRVNVPCALFLFKISHLILSADPFLSPPLGNTLPADTPVIKFEVLNDIFREEIVKIIDSNLSKEFKGKLIVDDKEK